MPKTPKTAPFPEPTPENPLGLFPAPPKPHIQPWRRFSPGRLAMRRRMSRELFPLARPGLEAKDSEGVLQMLHQLVPVDVMDAFERAGGTLHLLPAGDFKAWWMSVPRWNVAARAWRAWDTMGLMGFYDPARDNLVAVNGDCSSRSPFKRAFLGWKTGVDIAGHELGHFVDFCCRKVSRTDSFNRVFLMERHMLDTYAAGNVEEFFADAFWLHCAYPDVSAKYLPLADKWFSRFFLEGEPSRPQGQAVTSASGTP